MMQPPGMGIMRKLLSSSEGRSSSMTGFRLIVRSTGGGNGWRGSCSGGMGATRPRIVVAASDRRVMTARQRHDHATVYQQLHLGTGRHSADRFTALLFG
jgi:hypothetical protein